MGIFSSSSKLESDIGFDLFLTSEEWTNRLFQALLTNRQVIGVNDLKLRHGKSCIISDPEATMCNVYLGNHLDSCIQKLRYALMEAPSARLKPLVLIVRGTGGGKTRLFEELRMHYNQANDTAALSITFNNKMDYSMLDELFLDSSFMTLNIMFSIMTRLMAIVYEVPFGSILNYVKKTVAQIDCEGLRHSDEIESFCRSIFQRMIQDIDASLRRVDPGGLKNFILFVDEVMILQDSLQESKLSDAESFFKLAISILAKVLLNDQYTINSGSGVVRVNTCLAISSLEVPITGKTGAARPICILTVPERLNAREIVTQWWTTHIRFLRPVDLFRLMLVAETLSTQPRVISFAADFMKSFEYDEANAPLSESFVTAEFLMKLYAHIFMRLTGHYTVNTGGVKPSLLMSLVYGDSVSFDAEAANMIRRSFFTNSLVFMREDVEFSPTGSLLMLAGVVDPLDTNSNSPFVETVNLLNLYVCFSMLLRRTIDIISRVNAREGDSLEVLSEWWLKCRIAAARATGAISIPLRRLFPFASRCLDGDLEVTLPSTPSYFVKWRDVRNTWPILSTEKSKLTQFAKAFNSTSRLHVNNQFIMYESREGQAFDQLISFLVAKDGQPRGENSQAYLVFLDEKSSAVRVIDRLDTAPRDLNCMQFERVLALQQELSALVEEEGLILNKESQALVDGRFKFVYITTYKNVHLTSQHSNVLACNEAEAEVFFGIVWPFVRTCRSPSSE